MRATKPDPAAIGLPIAFLLAAMVSIQVGASLAKQLFPTIGAEGATTLRLVFAAAILLIVWRPWRISLSRTNAPWIVAYGAALGAMNLLFYLALNTIPLGVAVAVEFTGPLALAMALSRQKLDFAWVALAGAGVAMLLPLGDYAASLDLTGLALAFGAGLCWAIYIVCGRRAGAGHGGQATAYGMVIAAIIAAPLGAVEAGGALLSPAVLPIAVTVALMSSVVPYSLEMYALTRVPMRTFGILMSAEPAVAALAGFALLSERLTVLQWTAIACVIAASAGSAATARSELATPVAT